MSHPPSGEYPPLEDHPHAYPGQRRTNSLAVAALVCGIVFAPLGVIFGHMSLSQIKRSGEEGRPLAIAGLVIGYLVMAAAVIGLVLVVLFTYVMAQSLNDAFANGDRGSPGSPGTTAPTSGRELPAFTPPKNLGGNCQYRPTPEPAAKPNTPPRAGKVPTDPAEVSASLSTDRGNIGLQLDNAKSPCTVNNFASLAQQGYFDDTTCHRLTTSAQLGVLQCGDPSGTGQGGPGYSFANEYPTNQYRLTDPAVDAWVRYPRGTLAMANAGRNTNGSQFFLVYQDSMLPPTYTVFGTIDATGLQTIDRIAAGGVDGGGEDGEPATEVTITSVRLD